MYQTTIVVGHVGRDPEMRYTQSGVPVTSFSVATTRRWTSASGEQQEKTTWFRVTCWRKLAELTAQYVKKGRLVLVEGDIEASAFTDREGNAQCAAWNSPRPTSSSSADAVKVARAVPGGAGGGEDFPVHEDEIPF